MADLREHVALVEQETVHVPDKPQILLIPRSLADSLSPLLDRLQDPVLHPRGSHRRPLREPSHQLIQEFLRADLKLEGVAAILDADVEELCQSAPHMESIRALCVRLPTASASKATF